jgi:hypothetical protein
MISQNYNVDTINISKKRGKESVYLENGLNNSFQALPDLRIKIICQLLAA